MSLVLTFRKGGDFFVDDAQFFVDEIVSNRSVTVRGANRSFDIYSDKAVEILPSCRVSLSDRSEGGQVHLSFEAPRSINIATGDKIRAGRQPSPTAVAKPDASAAPLSVRKAALEQAHIAGIYGNVAERLVELVNQAAPVTHVAGNRRFEEYVFRVDGQVIESVVKLTPDELAALNLRHYRERTGKLKPWVKTTGG